MIKSDKRPRPLAAMLAGVRQIFGGFVGYSTFPRDDRAALVVAMSEIRDAVQAAKSA